VTRVLDITAALERRKRAGRWTARLDADGSLVIVGHDDQGDEDIRLTWPAKEAERIVGDLYRMIQVRRHGERLVAFAESQQKPPRPPRKWKRCGCTREGWFACGPSGARGVG